MKTIAAVLMLLLASFKAAADGLPLKDGRYPGPVIIFKLSPAQRETIDHYRTCQLENFKTMNVYTPYIFTLEPDQILALKKRSPVSPHYFEIYETYRGFNDAGPHWNLALRFSENKIEIPIDLLASEKESIDSQIEQGWRLKNPCFPQVGRK